MDPGADGVFRLIARKLASSLRWKAIAGEATFVRYIRHCREEGRIWREQTTEEDAVAALMGEKAQKEVVDLVALVPVSRPISKAALEEAALRAEINRRRVAWIARPHTPTPEPSISASISGNCLNRTRTDSGTTNHHQ